MNAHALPVAVRPYGIAPDAFRAALRQLPGGVSVITAGIGEDRTGLTVTSFSSLSADPPTVVVSVNQGASALPVIGAYRHFGVNVLGSGHRRVAENFTGKGGLRGPHRYAGAEWFSLSTGASLLEGAAANLDCEVEDLIERHSHVLIIGRVVGAQVAADAGALVYWQGEYRPQRPTDDTLARGLAPF